MAKWLQLVISGMKSDLELIFSNVVMNRPTWDVKFISGCLLKIYAYSYKLQATSFGKAVLPWGT